MEDNHPTQLSLADWKTEIISSGVVLICLLLLIFFPTNGTMQEFSKYLLFLFILPTLYIKLILKKKLSNFGLSLRNPRFGLVWAAMMLIVSIITISILFNFFDFANNYFLPAYLASNFWLFLFNELVLTAIIMFINVFFYQGFILFSLIKKFGLASAIIQALFLTLLVISTSTLNWKLAPTIILSFTGGIVTYKTRSFIYAYLMSLIFMISLDAYIIHIFK